jgi:WhiB family redox-sensing transcriptional regulator
VTAVPLEAPARYRDHASVRLSEVAGPEVVGPDVLALDHLAALEEARSLAIVPSEVAPLAISPDEDTIPSRGGLRMLPPRREVHADLAEWQWQTDAACRRADPDLFFHPWGERDPSRSRRDAAAKAVCAACPVQLPCREVALATYEPYGVWGGLTEAEREQILGVRFG